MKKIYFVQAATTYNNKQSVYLPYAVGCLAAYSMSIPEISASFETAKIFFDRETPERVADEMSEPFLVAFSCCLWNIEYSKKLARIIKERQHNCAVVFGGHSVSPDAELLRENPFIDYLICGEGEEPFAALLLALDGKADISEVPGLSYRRDGEIVQNERREQYDCSKYPSPYTSGVFDGILKENPGVPFNAILETNRGCPYGCAYCEWCFTDKLRRFPMEKIKAELDWISENKIEYCYCADANFGILPRDCEIAEYAVQVKKKNGYPFVFRPTYANGGGNTVFNAGCILNHGGIDKGVTVSFQSLSDEVLHNIGRVNFSFDKNSHMVKRFASAGIAAYSELILGLPGETYESFCSGLCRLLDMGNYSSISVYNCQVYSNAMLGQAEYRKKFGIRTATVPIRGIHYSADFNGIPEYFDIVVATDSMPFDKWIEANLFSVAVQTFHSNGLLRFFAVYLHREKIADYFTFYDALLKYIMQAEGTRINVLFSDFASRFRDTVNGDWVYRNKEFGDIGWYFDEGAFLELASHIDSAYAELLPFLQRYFPDSHLLCQLLLFQREMVRRPFIAEAETEFDYDFYSYFSSLSSGIHSPLLEKKCTLTVKASQDKSTQEYAKNIILFGKRRGETLLFRQGSLFEWKINEE